MNETNGQNPLEGILAPDPTPKPAKPARKARKPRPTKGFKAFEAGHETNGHPDPADYRPGNAKAIPGRLASEIASRAVTWFIQDLIPLECLTFVIGPPDAGKSTMGAWAASKAKRPAIMPGYEESVEVMLMPRLKLNGVKMQNCLILDTRLWSMPHDRQALTDALLRHQADLLWIDPVDSYVSECSENDGQGVRNALEAFARIAADVGCAVVGVRHPGKDPRNLCPGSRAWRAVPRMILQLSVDAGPPVRRFIGPARDPFGGAVKAREVHLDGFDRAPKTFRLGAYAKAQDVESASVADVIDRSMIDSGVELLKALLANGEQESTVIYKHAEQERLKDRTMRQAARRLGVVIRRDGTGLEHRSYWSLSDSGTPAERKRDTPKPKSTLRSEGVPLPDCQSARVEDPPPPTESSSET